MQRYAAAGEMPTYAALMRGGARAATASPRASRPTPARADTMATGAWPGVHGSTNNTFFHRPGRDFSRNGTSPDHQGARGAVGRLGRRTGRQEGRPAGVDRRPHANINGPTVDFATFFSRRGVLESRPTRPSRPRGRFGLSYQVAAFDAGAAAGRNVRPARGDPAAADRR